MKDLDIQLALAKQKRILEDLGYKVAYICVYGSQNYNLDIYTEEYQSDIDMKAVVVPTLDDLVRDGKPVSKVFETEWGQVDVKDIRMYIQTVLKANPAYIETLFTKHFIIDDMFKHEFCRILNARDELVEALKAQFLRAMYGMMCEKEKAMCHPYPTIAHKIEKFGYDGKQCHHVLRLYLLMENYFVNGFSLDKAIRIFTDMELEALMKFKLNEYSLETAKGFTADIMSKGKRLRDGILNSIDESKIDYSVKTKILSLSKDIIKNKIVTECRGY